MELWVWRRNFVSGYKTKEQAIKSIIIPNLGLYKHIPPHAKMHRYIHATHTHTDTQTERDTDWLTTAYIRLLKKELSFNACRTHAVALENGLIVLARLNRERTGDVVWLVLQCLWGPRTTKRNKMKSKAAWCCLSTIQYLRRWRLKNPGVQEMQAGLHKFDFLTLHYSWSINWWVQEQYVASI